MAERKGMSKKTRFEVFKRDRFTCQYCGRQAPGVVLQVDHVVPVVSGGTDDLLNLVTSCFECNSGKGPRELTDDSALVKQRAQLDAIAEREEQIGFMLQWKRSMARADDAEVDAADEYLSDLTDNHLTEAGKKTIARLIRQYGLLEVMTAIEIGVESYWGSGDDQARSTFFRRLPGILRNRKLERDDPLHGESSKLASIARHRLRQFGNGDWWPVYHVAHRLLERGMSVSEIMNTLDPDLLVQDWIEDQQ